MTLVDQIVWTITIAILISPFVLIFFLIKGIVKLIKNRKARKNKNAEWKSEWVWNEETKLWEHPLSAKGDTTYRYTKENIPKDETPEVNQQTHFHHEDTSFKVGKTEYTGPKFTSKEQETTYRYAKENIPKDEARGANRQKYEPPRQNTTVKEEPRKTAQTAAAGPRIIYTYSKPELKAEDMDQATGEELDFKTAYQRKPLFTRNEWQNYKKLQDIAEVRGFVICPKSGYSTW